MPGWNIADVLEVVVDERPESPAIIVGDRTMTWGELWRRAGGLGAALVRAGVDRQANVALYVRNRSEYLESFVGCLKAALVPFNTNYRYVDDELVHLWSDADAQAVIFQGTFTDRVARVRDRLPSVKAWVWVDDGSGTCPDWALEYEQAASSPEVAGYERTPDDLVILYTGGTTGMPKGVMWRQDDLFSILAEATSGRYPIQQDLDFARTRVAATPRRHHPAAPLMHGTGSFTCLPFLWRGGAIVLAPSEGFDPIEMLDLVARHRVNSVAWVGDVFARPVADLLDASPGKWDLTSWQVVTSGGLAFSDGAKSRLLAHIPDLKIADVYGASETLAVGRRVSTGSSTPHDVGFDSTTRAIVLRDDGSEVTPGSGEAGRIAFAGRHPLGYYNDAEKTARTWVRVGDERYAMTGDMATVAEDGRMVLIGRGSTSINTGGEKVFPEEVEEAIGSLDFVHDVAVAGVPDERFGEAVAALVVVRGGAVRSADQLRDELRSSLAGYKIPRRVAFVDVIPRVASGKPDLPAVRALLDS